jgi:hypothetical protein
VSSSNSGKKDAFRIQTILQGIHKNKESKTMKEWHQKMGITVDGNKDKEYIRIFNKWRDYDFMCCVMATLGLVV